MDVRTKGIIVAIIASSAWGFMGLFTRTLSDYGLSVYDMSFIRAGIATLGMGVLLLIFDRDSLKIGKKDVILFMALGATKLISDACIFTAELNIPLALAGILQLTYPYFVMIFAYFVFRDRIMKKKVLAAILGFTGCVLVADLANGGDVKIIGIILALISSIVTAANIIGNKFGTNKGLSPTTLVFYTFLFSAIFTIPFTNIPHIAEVAVSGSTAIFYMLGIGILMTMIPHALGNWSISKVDASSISIIGMMEAIMAAICGVIFFDEIPTVAMVCGIILAIIAMIVVSKVAINDEKERSPVSPR